MIRRLAITVEPNHIAYGIRGDGNHCPIALALRSVLSGVSATVCQDSVLINEDAGPIRAGDYVPTVEMVAFMDAFDADEEVGPVTFFLNVAELEWSTPR